MLRFFIYRPDIIIITTRTFSINNQQLSNFNDTQELVIIKKIIKTKEINEIVWVKEKKESANGSCFLQPYVGSKFCRFIAFLFYNFTNPPS